MRNSSLQFRVFCAAGFLLAAVVVMWAFLRGYSPEKFQVASPPLTGYDREALKKNLAPKQVDELYERIIGLGSRTAGQKGNRACAALIRDTYKTAGLTVMAQDVDSVAPSTQRSEILDASGKKLDVACYPLPANLLQPSNTPSEGLKGRLVLITDEYLRSAQTFTDAIALVDFGAPLPKMLGDHPKLYADRGFKAILYTCSTGLEKMPWQSLARKFLRIPFNYPRLFVGAEIMEQQGKEVTLKVNTSLRSEASQNIIGILSAGGDQAREALIVPVSYDGATYLPDQNFSSIHALQLAVQLQVVKSIALQKKDLRRDVIFLATGNDYNAFEGVMTFLRALGRTGEVAVRGRVLQERLAENVAQKAHADKAVALFSRPGFLTSVEETAVALDSLSADAAKFFLEQQKYAVRTVVEQASNDLQTKKIAFNYDFKGDIKSPAFRIFRNAQGVYNKLNVLSSYGTIALTEALVRDGDVYQLRKKLEERFSELQKFHDRHSLQLQQDIALNQQFQRYRSVVVLSPMLFPGAPGTQSEGLLLAADPWLRSNTALCYTVKRVVDDSIGVLGLRKKIDAKFATSSPGISVSLEMWDRLGYPSAVMYSANNPAGDLAVPAVVDLSERVGTIKNAMLVFGETVQAVAFGSGLYKPTLRRDIFNPHGSVFAAGIGSSVVPNFPVAGAILANKGMASFGQDSGCPISETGCSFRLPFIATDLYGRYSCEYNDYYFSNTLMAVSYGLDGIIRYAKDDGQAAQNFYRSVLVSQDKLEGVVNQPLFRCAPVAILDRVNPQTMRTFLSATFIRKIGLSAFDSSNLYTSDDGFLGFIPPEDKFYVTLQAGSAENPLVAKTRAFLLNVPADYVANPEVEIDGLGYLPKNYPLIRNIPEQIARSMLLVNDKRLGLQKKFDMANDLLLDFHAKGADYIAQTEQGKLSQNERMHLAESSAIYSILNHPFIRENVSEAVVGVLWYMALMVPFVFFMEKLIFGFNDLRKQLLAEGLIFLVAFILLWQLHPAFQMIRSSLMILLGFCVILISMGVTFLLYGKFKENMDALQQGRGMVKGASSNTAGVVMTAFMLGLNNMHRRKVRTGLTCATLVLLTFVMICFTSVQNDIVDRAISLGKAPYNGILIKNESFARLTPAEVDAIGKRYSDFFPVVDRKMYVGRSSGGADSTLYAPQINIIYQGDGSARSVVAKSCLLFSSKEPLRKKIPLIAGKWFDKDGSLGNGELPPVIIPDKLATRFFITPEMLKDQTVSVLINNVAYQVVGIFDSEKFARVRDLDGNDLLPFDVESIVTPKLSGGEVLADNSVPHISPEDVVLCQTERFPASLPVFADKGIAIQLYSYSAVIDMDGVAYKATKNAITDYLEQSGRETFYGLGGYSFIGKRGAESSMTGLLDMLIPIFIAALTVLNTMKGSVYERRDEIFVYNAVGIAPRYVFFMFFAEAFVYIVVGSVLGYILSQGAGTILTALNLTGGMKMSFASLSTIYVSLAIAVAVLLSTLFPALSAKAIAEPSDDSGWKLPEPEGSTLRFEMPFTFSRRDRIAVIAFLHRFLLEHSEGSSGSFFAGEISAGVSDQLDSLDGDSHIPLVSSMIWLKPFDLGVSQMLQIQLATDPDTKEYGAQVILTLQSGTRDAWLRLNKPFVSRLRQHFLHWRAASEPMKVELFDEAKNLLTSNYRTGDTTNV